MTKRRNKSKEMQNSREVEEEIREKKGDAYRSHMAGVIDANEKYPNVPNWLKEKAFDWAAHMDKQDGR